MFIFSKSYLKEHGTSNMTLDNANDGDWLGLKENDILKL